MCLDGHHLILEGVFGPGYGMRPMRIIMHLPKTIAIYLQHSSLGPARELGDVMRRGSLKQETRRTSSRAKKSSARVSMSVRADHRDIVAVVRLTPSRCSGCGGLRRLTVDATGFHATCERCHTVEPVTLSVLYSIVETAQVRCSSCGKLMEVRWAPAGQYYLACRGKCGNIVPADALRMWIEEGIQPENVSIGDGSEIQ